MWHLAIDKEPARFQNAREIPLRGENGSGAVPICPIHKLRMKLHHGRFGNFWSCKAFSQQGGWCKYTINVPRTRKASYAA
jgi:hypothetical protein